MRFTANLILICLLIATQTSSSELDSLNSVEEWMLNHLPANFTEDERLMKFLRAAKSAWNTLKPNLNGTVEIFFKRVNRLSERFGEDNAFVNAIIDDAERFAVMVLEALDSYFGEIKGDKKNSSTGIVPTNQWLSENFEPPNKDSLLKSFDGIARDFWIKFYRDVEESMTHFTQLMTPLWTEESIVVKAAFNYTGFLVKRFQEVLLLMADRTNKDYPKIDRSKLEEPDYESYADAVRGLLDAHLEAVNNAIVELTNANDMMIEELKNISAPCLRKTAGMLLWRLWHRVTDVSVSEAEMLCINLDALKMEGRDYSPIVDLTISLVNIDQNYFKANTVEKRDSTIKFAREYPDHSTHEKYLEDLIAFHGKNFESTIKAMRNDADQLSEVVFGADNGW